LTARLRDCETVLKSNERGCLEISKGPPALKIWHEDKRGDKKKVLVLLFSLAKDGQRLLNIVDAGEERNGECTKKKRKVKRGRAKLSYLRQTPFVAGPEIGNRYPKPDGKILRVTLQKKRK